MPLMKGIFTFPGQVLMCDFGPEPDKVAEPGIMKGPLSVPPEIFKERHVVVLSGFNGLSIIVPFSTVAPKTPQKYHFCIPAGTYGFFDPNEDNWAKSDLIANVSNERLDRPFSAGKRSTVSLSKDDFAKVRETVLHALGLSRLTQHL